MMRCEWFLGKGTEDRRSGGRWEGLVAAIAMESVVSWIIEGELVGSMTGFWTEC